MDHLVGGHVVEHQRGDLRVIEPFRYGDKMLGLAYQKLSLSAVDDQRAHPLTYGQPRHPRSDGIDVAYDLISRRERERRSVEIGPRSHDDVRRSGTRRAHPDANLAGLRFWHGQ